MIKQIRKLIPFSVHKTGIIFILA